MKRKLDSRLASRTLIRLEELETRLAPATLVDPLTVTYQDADGDRATVRLSVPLFDPKTVNDVLTFNLGSVDGDDSRPQQLRRVDLSILDPALARGVSLTVTTDGPVGDGLAHVGHVNAMGLDLGTVSVNGDLGRVDAGDETISTAGLLSLRVHSMGRFGTSTQPPGGNLSSGIQGELRGLVVDSDMVGASVQVIGGPQGRVGTVNILGSLRGNSATSLGQVSSSGEMGFVVIGGTLEGRVRSGGYIMGVVVGGAVVGGDAGESGSISSSGGIGPVQIGGDLRGGAGTDSGRIRTEGPLGNVVVNGSLLGAGPGSATIASTDSMGLVLITGDVRGGTGAASGRVLSSMGAIAGVSIGGSLVGTATDTAFISSQGNLGPVDISGAMRGGTGGNSGSIYSGRFITRVTVGATVLGGDGGASAQIRSLGGVGPVLVGGDMRGGFGSESGRVRTHGDLGNVQIRGSLIGGGPGSGSLLADGAVGLVQITGDVRGGTGDTAARIHSALGTIAGVSIGGSLVGTEVDTALISSRWNLGPVDIGGAVQGGRGGNSGAIDSGGYITRITVGLAVTGGDGGGSGEFNSSGGIGPVIIGGDLRAGTGAESGRIRTQGDLGSVQIRGSLIGSGPRSAWLAADGAIGPVQITGDVRGGTGVASARITSSVGTIAGVTIGGSLIGTEQDTATISSQGNLGPVDIGGRVQGGAGGYSAYIHSGGYITRVTVGQAVTGDGGGSGQIHSNGGVGPVSIGGDLRAGLGGESGRVRTHGDIGDVTIRGSMIGSGDNSGSLLADGGIGLVYITGDVRGGTTDVSARILASNGGIVGVIIGGSLVGNAASTGRIFSQRNIGLLVIDGDVQGGTGANSGFVSAIGSIDLVWVTGSVVGGVGNDSGTIRAAQVGALQIGGSVNGGQGNDSGTIRVGGIGPVEIEGSISGGAGLNSGSLRTTGNLASIRVGGSLVGGSGNGTGLIVSQGDMGFVRIDGDLRGGSTTGTATLDISGYIQGRRIASVHIQGSIIAGSNSGSGRLIRSGSVRAQNDIGTLHVGGHLLGDPTNPVILSARGQASPGEFSDVAIENLRVGGSVAIALILGGYDVNGVGTNADAQIGTVRVDGDWIASSLAAGVTAGPDGFFGTDDDARLSGTGVRDDPNILSALGEVEIDGMVWGSGSGTDHYGFVAEWVQALEVTGTAVSLTEGPHNDWLALTSEEDVTVVEVSGGEEPAPGRFGHHGFDSSGLIQALLKDPWRVPG